MFLFFFLIQVETDTIQPDTLTKPPFVLREFGGWFEKFNNREVHLVNDGYFFELSQPLKILGGRIEETGLIDKSQIILLQDYEKPALFLNGVPFKDPISGVSDLDQIPVDYAREVSIGNNYYGGYLPAGSVNITSRKNLSDTAFSQIRFLSGSYGASKLGLDLNRHLTRNLGSHLAYHKTKNLGYRTITSSDQDVLTGSLYGKIGTYFNTDFYSASNHRGLPRNLSQTKKIYGGAMTGGNLKTRLAFSYFYRYFQLNGYQTDTFNHHSNSLCLSGQTGRTRRHYQFDLGADGIYHIFQSNYQSHDKWLESNLWARVNFNIARFFITGRIGVNNYQFKELSLEPQLETRYTITDSLTISLVIRRVCQRAGYIATNFAADTTMGLKIKGNPDLKPEIHSQGRIGLSYRQLFISFYQSHCDRPIRMILDNQGYQKLENCNSVKSYGVFGTASLCCLKYLSLYGGGNYSSRDSGRYYLIGGEVLYDLETVSFRGRYEQTFINQPVHSLMFGLRFLDFHLYLWIDNLFNTELIPAQPRAFLFGIFWNFLN